MDPPFGYEGLQGSGDHVIRHDIGGFVGTRVNGSDRERASHFSASNKAKFHVGSLRFPGPRFKFLESRPGQGCHISERFYLRTVRRREE